MSLRKIIHVDMDAFFASVEQRDNPQLRGRPVAVGHAGGRGVVAAASYEARRYGVRSAMPSSKAARLCPELIFVDGRFDVYKDVSRSIHEIFHRYTDIIEPISLDEAFLDVTVNKPGISMAVEIAIEIKQAIRRELSLVASAGVSYNKFLAKIASDYRKPDGLCTIHPSRALDFIDRLDVESFWGVGPVTARRMHAMGIHTGADLRGADLSDLIRAFGKMGPVYYEFARGIDTRPVVAERRRKSVGCERTMESDISDPESARAVIASLAGELVARMSRHDFRGRTLTLKVRFHDFRLITRSVTLLSDIAGDRASEERVVAAAGALLGGIDVAKDPVRLLGLSVGLSSDSGNPAGEWRQLTLDL